MILGNYLAKIAPRDGSIMGVVSPLLLFEPLFNSSQSMAQFRGPEMTMIGNGATAHWVLLARHSLPAPPSFDVVQIQSGKVVGWSTSVIGTPLPLLDKPLSFNLATVGLVLDGVTAAD